ncbi:HAD-IA family hydrolase [Vibrio paucivorans]|uniref:HAD-IA family hydrolase n=1 Tax=Vibrio paucivorans TaxID=2829489 RepID=A0A9X3CHJ4_9VIBR|nr:HAD-IA family hydrolase [Vibrio paucivorans]MCW8334880.1 HAD-IA family hydrolase [Vibrio paucivorans]
MNNPIKCVIFDCDGTLVDSEILCCQALVNIFNRLGVRYSLSEATNRFEGGKLADILASASQDAGVSIPLDTLEPLYREEVTRLFELDLKPMLGARDLLEFLMANRIDFCVASNGPRSKIIHSLKLTHLEQYFTGNIFSAFDTNSWKPEPDLIRYSAMNMGYTLFECVYVDDTLKGVEAGIRAGVKTFQLVNSSTSSIYDDVETLPDLPSLQHWLSAQHNLLNVSLG